jgi:hypothetical protein
MNIIEMARKAGIKSGDMYKLTVGLMSIETLERFAALVAAHEREECAIIVEQMNSLLSPEIAAVIRARGSDEHH